MKLFWILISVFFLINLEGYGQCVFHKLYSYNPTELDFGSAVIKSNDGGFIVVGNADITIGVNAVFAVKTDECGDTIWQTAINLNTIGGCPGLSVVQLQDDNIVICGWRFDIIEYARDAYLLKLDSNGDTIWLKTVDGGYNDYGIMHKPTSDGGFIIGGHYTDTVSWDMQVFLIKTDCSGNIEWQQNYGDTGDDYLKSIDFTPDGGYIIGGNFENPGTSSWDLYLLKTDSQGNEKWRKYYGTTLTEDKGYAITTQDSGYAIVGYTENAAGDYNGYIVKTDSLGGIEWQKDYGYSTEDDLFKIVKQLPVGKYLIAGGKADTTTTNGRLVWLIKMDTNGDTIWTKSYTYYGENTHTYVEDLQLTSDGGCVMTGYITGNPLPNSNDLWLLKTDSLGNICEIDTTTWEGCSELVSVAELGNNNEAENIIIYPNPTTENITVECNGQNIQSIEIIDFLGRTVKTINDINEPGKTVVISDLKQGLYFVRVHTDRFVETKKVIVTY